MSKPQIHAESSVRHYGGNVNDYIEIHSFIDSSKGAISDNRHRALTHTSWFLMNILERIKFSNSIEASNNTFPTIKNSDGKIVSVRDIGEKHILEDYKDRFIPTAQDFLQEIPYEPWMNNGDGLPPSVAVVKINKTKVPLNRMVFDGSNHRYPNTLPEYQPFEPFFPFTGNIIVSD